MRQLLQAGEPVLGGVEARLEQPQCERRQRQHLAAPGHRFALELLERHDGVDEAPLECLTRVVLAAEEPDLLSPLLADLRSEDARAVAAVEGADARARLPEAGVLGGDREVADDVQDVAAADRVPRDHRNDWLGRAADLHVQVGDVEAPDRVGFALVAAVAAHPLVAARAERVGTLAGEHDHADGGVLAGAREGVAQLDDGLRAEGVADLWTVDRDLRDPGLAGELVADVGVVAAGDPFDRVAAARWSRHGRKASLSGVRVEAWLTRSARRFGDRIAVETVDRRISYRELDRLAGAGARELSVAPGANVAIALPPGLDFVVALHACLRAGAVAVPIDLRDPLRPGPLEAVELVIDRPLDCRATALPASGHELDAPAVLVRTSGSSGEPKTVPLSYGNFLWSAIGSAVALGLDPRERWLCTLPLVHVGGLGIVLRSAIYGTTAVVHERFELAAALQALMEREITLVSVVATTLRRLIDGGLSHPPALRCALAGGGPLPRALLERARAAGVVVSETYGLTEACSQVATQTPDAGDQGAHGAAPPLFCTRVQLAADAEILVRGPTVSAAVAGGELATGDLGELLADGSLRVLGRKSDTIISGGENVAPSEVEAVLEEHPEVTEAAVFAVADERWGEAVHALVVARGTVDEAELRAHCAARLAAYKVPKAIGFAQTLPRTASGKLQRQNLPVDGANATT